MKHNLTKDQRALLVGWAAEGLTLSEINDRAAKEDPPFKVLWHQLKHVRTRTDKTYSQIKEEFERDALNEGLARRAVRIRQLEELFDLHIALIKARGNVMKGEIDGGETGLLARDYKGKDADTPVYKYDAALIREVRGIFDDIARELGERKTNVDLSASISGPFAVNVIIDGPATTSSPGDGDQKPSE